MPYRYEPSTKEKYWQDFWAKKGLNRFDPDSNREVFNIDTPPPTVSGFLHLGHVFSYTQAEVIARYQKRQGATAKEPAVSGLGISVDEWQRARTDSGIAWQVLEYPLLDLRMNRHDCVKVIEDTGLPVPPKSSCWFCPFHSRGEWMRLKREEPEQFQRAVVLEQLLNKRRAKLGKDNIYLHASAQPLDRAVGDQYAFEFDDSDLPCDTGYCFL